MGKVFLNTITFIAAVVINYLTNSGIGNLKTVGEVSKLYDSLFTPAGYAFAIWGLIYLLLIAFIAYQWYSTAKNNKEIIDRVGYWFAISNIAIGLWVLVWIHQFIFLSVVIMLLLLFSLIQIVRRLDMELYDVPLSRIAFVWWPICVYFGWIVLATVANVSAFLVSTGWNGQPLTPVIWTILMIGISLGIYILLIHKRNLREAAAVGIWGLTAITYKQQNNEFLIALCSTIASVLLFIYILLHAYKNRATLPIIRNYLKK